MVNYFIIVLEGAAVLLLRSTQCFGCEFSVKGTTRKRRGGGFA